MNLSASYYLGAQVASIRKLVQFSWQFSMLRDFGYKSDVQYVLLQKALEPIPALEDRRIHNNVSMTVSGVM